MGAIPRNGLPLRRSSSVWRLLPRFWVFPILHVPYTLHAASMLQALHVAAGALGASVLAAKLLRCQSVGFVAGAAYMVYGGFYSNAEHPDIVRAFSLLPWLFLGVPAGAR